MDVIKNPSAEGNLEDMIRITVPKDTNDHIKIWFNASSEQCLEVALSNQAAERFAITILKATGFFETKEG